MATLAALLALVLAVGTLAGLVKPSLVRLSSRWKVLGCALIGFFVVGWMASGEDSRNQDAPDVAPVRRQINWKQPVDRLTFITEIVKAISWPLALIVAITLCANMSETTSSSFITVEGEEVGEDRSIPRRRSGDCGRGWPGGTPKARAETV